MPNLFTPIAWNDGPSGNTPITAARGPNRWESGIEALDDALDALTDQVSSLGAAGGTAVFGPSSGRPQPLPMRWYLDTTLGKAIYGDGTGWHLADGTAVTTIGRPGDFTAVGNSDNSIDLTWTAVASASFYTVYSAQYPGGVPGFTSVAGLSAHIGPLTTLGTFTYWVTATVGGVESPISDSATVTLPVSGGSSGGGATPASILNIGTGSTQNHYNDGIGFSSGHTDITMAQLIAGYNNSPYTTPNGGGTAVLLRVYMNGGTTSANTNYPRNELREMESDGVTKMAFDAHTGTHSLSGSSQVTHLQPNKPWVVIAQMHDDSDDTIQIIITGSTTSSLQVSAKINGSTVSPVLDSSYHINDVCNWKFTLTNGTVKFYIDNTLILTSSAFVSTSGSIQYFKAGNYPQSSATHGGMESPTEYSEVALSNLVTSHA